jgi:hypothetical protein
MRALIIKDGVVDNVVELPDGWKDPRVSVTIEEDGNRKHWCPPSDAKIIVGEKVSEARLGYLYEESSDSFIEPVVVVPEEILRQQALDAIRQKEEQMLLDKYYDDPDAPEEVKQYRERIDEVVEVKKR